MLLIDETGAVAHKYYQDFAQSYPKACWVEHDPELIWRTVLHGFTEILSLPGVHPEALAGVGITNQRETVVLWERSTGKPVYPAIVWQCRRTTDRCTELIAGGLEPMIQSKTGLRIDPYFSATKIEWLLTQNPDLKRRAENGELACGTIDTWLIWKLTGGKVHATEYSNASRTMLFNIHNLAWDPELMKLFGIPAAILPEVRESGAYFGDTLPAFTGGRSIPIHGVLGDQQAALFGQGCLEPGMMKNTYGTGCFLLMNTGERIFQPENGLLVSVAWGIGGKVQYVLEGSVFMAGAVIQWLRDELGIIARAADSEGLALSVPDTQGVYLVPAFTGLGAPHWDPYARGLLIGLSRGVNRAHIIRAALEAIAYQVREVMEGMSKTVQSVPVLLRVDGGAAANNFLLQFQADICGLPIQRNHSLELTGAGVAYLAGFGVGLWKNTAELTRLIEVEQTFTPRISPANREKLWQGWLRAVERSKGWAKEPCEE
jgi:glycerol kinase